jgi:sugar lactone lactonase YvrE
MNRPNFFKTLLAFSLFAAAACYSTQAALGDLFETDQGGSTIFKFTPVGAKSTFATGLGGPFGVAVDAFGNVFEANFNDGMILKFTPTGVQSTFASGLNGPIALAFDAGGNLFAADSVANMIFKFTPTGVKTTFASGLSTPVALAFDASGNLFEADHGSNRIFKFTPAGVKSTFASGLHGPFGLAFDAWGNLFESDSGSGSIIKFTAGVKSTFASGLNAPIGLAFDASGNLFEADQGSGTIFKFTPAGAKSTFASGLNLPSGLAFEPPPPGAPLRFETESLQVQSKTPAPSGVFNSPAASGGAGTYFNANTVGNYITYTLPVANPGTYWVRVGIQTRSNKGIFQLAINGLNVGQPQDEYNVALGYVARDVGAVSFSVAGNYAFKFTVTGKNASSSGRTLAFDYIELMPPHGFEIESLQVQSKTPAPSGVFNSPAASGGAGTYFNANAVGNYITYTLPVANPGTYLVRVGIQTRSNKGIFQLAINGLNVGQPQDEYNVALGYVARDVGTVSFPVAGNYAFKFTVTGKNASSTGYTLAFDYIELQSFFPLNFSTVVSDCGGDFFVGTFMNPFGRDALLQISGTVDDDLLVDGIVIQDGEFPFTDTANPPCPGSGVLNGIHDITYLATVSAHQTVSISVRNNFRGTASINGTLVFQ